MSLNDVDGSGKDRKIKFGSLRELILEVLFPCAGFASVSVTQAGHGEAKIFLLILNRFFPLYSFVFAQSIAELLQAVIAMVIRSRIFRQAANHNAAK